MRGSKVDLLKFRLSCWTLLRLLDSDDFGLGVCVVMRG